MPLEAPMEELIEKHLKISGHNFVLIMLLHGCFRRNKKVNFRKIIDYFGGFVNNDKEHLCKFMLIYFKNISRDKKVRITLNS